MPKQSAEHSPMSARSDAWVKKRADDQSLKTLATSARSLRKSCGLSVDQLASRLGVSVKAVYHIERGENWPSMLLYISLCRELGQPKPPMT